MFQTRHSHEKKLREFIDEFDIFVGRVNGRSGDLYGELDGASVDFSDFIAWRTTKVHVSQGNDDWIAITPDVMHGVDPSSDEFGATVFDCVGVY
ncbi:hypothetical protein GCM10009799_29120 [Nocardiopsis rhodophaea]|uniref:Uncharacterized protein n=1 Tax=Nocardiopsis rhodophaea TaxID=280238 RepID=A0ABN2T7N3_9ACTN